jgi:hypothetical protein
MQRNGKRVQREESFRRKREKRAQHSPKMAPRQSAAAYPLLARNSGRRSHSDVEEHRLVVALDPDIEPIDGRAVTRFARGNERVAPV